ncbi:MAG: hypothetical protein HGA66_15535 [Holophaga sp.]|nr:hypothetical protein [Holophaga sp.]
MFDERMILHRYKAASYAAIAGGLATAFFHLRSYYRGEGFRKDLFFILCVMAATKIVVLIYYRLKN